MKLEKRYRRSRRECTECAHRHCRHHPVWSKIEDLFPVTAPSRFCSAAARDLPFPDCCGKGRDINFPVTRFVGGIRYPLAIRRNYAVGLIARTQLKLLCLASRRRYPLQIV